jgi:hypothetical protein
MKWVLIKVLASQSGYSENAIRAKIKKGVWLQNMHWRKAPDGRILFNLDAIQAWIEGGASSIRGVA